ncbi:MAG: hypothetical protein ACI4M1_03170 [Christensenellales bacterium]
MTKFLTLLKVNLRQAYRTRKNTSKKTMPMWGIYVVLGVCLLPILAMIFAGCLKLGEFLSLPENSSYLSAAITFLITAIELINVFFGFRSMLGTVYMSTDSDMLLALPVRSVTVFFSKLVVCYLAEFATTLLMLVATLLPLGIGLSAGAGYFAALFFGAFLIPLISLLAVSVLSVPLLFVSNLFRNRGAVGTVVYVLLFAVLMGFYFWFVMNLSSFDGGGADLEAALGNFLEGLKTTAAYMYPNVWLSAAFTAVSFGGWIGNFALFLLCAAALVVLAGLLSNRIFLLNMRKSQENASRGKKTSHKFAGGNKIGSLIAADFKNIMRNSSLGFFCLSQVVIIPLFVAIYCLGINDSISQTAQEAKAILSSVSQIVLLVMGLMTCVTASCAVSREGENFYLIKTLPVKPSQFAWAKLIISMIFNGVAFALAVTLEAIFLKSGFVSAVLEFITVFCASLGVSAVQVLIDMKNPRLKWTTVQQGLKNNPSSLWGMLIGFATGAVLSVPVMVFALSGWGAAGMLIPMLLGVGIGIAGVLILLNNCEKYFCAVE